MTAPGQPEPTPEELAVALLTAQLDTAQSLTRKSQGADSAAEAKDFAQAALLTVQAVVVLDPSMSQGGTPLEHDVVMERTRGENAVAVERVRGENALKRAKEVAAAPTPAKHKSVSVRRDGHGRATEYSVEG